MGYAERQQQHCRVRVSFQWHGTKGHRGVLLSSDKETCPLCVQVKSGLIAVQCSEYSVELVILVTFHILNINDQIKHDKKPDNYKSALILPLIPIGQKCVVLGWAVA